MSDNPLRGATYDPRDLARQCYRMGTSGGYALAFSARIAAENPELPWPVFRNILQANGHGFCGYAESAVRRAFESGRTRRPSEG